jgi:hypothetical protein
VAKSIEEYTAEVSKSYDNSRNALQNQINAIEGNLATTQKQINENYANQQNLLNNQRNQAASAASMQAAGSGGSFGGRANIANKKYYEQTFVPAQTQLNTNQSQALENAQSQANSNRLTLESQLASLNDEIARQGLARYYDELEKERQAELQRKAIAAQQAAYASYLGQGGGGQSNVRRWDFGNGYSAYDNNGRAVYSRNGNQISAAEFLLGTKGGNMNNWRDMWGNGVSTVGVGSDTVSAFSNWNTLKGISGLGKYNYLTGIY